MRENQKRHDAPEYTDIRENGIHTIQLPGTTYWTNEDSDAQVLVARHIAPGRHTWIPFSFPQFIRGKEVVYEKTVVHTGHFSARTGFLRHIFFPHRARNVSNGTYGPKLVTDIVGKGSGLLRSLVSGLLMEHEWEQTSPTREADKETTVRGLCDISEAVQDRNVALLGNRYGGRFGIPLSITAYDELPYSDLETGTVRFGDMQTLRHVSKLDRFVHHDLPEISGVPSAIDNEQDFSQAVLYVRGFVCGMRMNSDPERIRTALPDIINIIAREDPTVVDTHSYILWLAKTQAKNLGILHALGLINSEYSARNMTLGGELTDLSACRAVKNPRQDFLTEIATLHADIDTLFTTMFRSDIATTPLTRDLWQDIVETYSETLRVTRMRISEEEERSIQ